MGIADLHAHTRHSSWGDGNQTVEELLDWVEQHTALDLFSITDHDNTEATRYAAELCRRRTYRFSFVPGVEVTNQGGHMLVLFPEGQVKDIPSLRSFWWTVRYAHAHGGICIPAHPVFPPWLAPTIERGLARGLCIDAFEAVNAGIPEGAQGRLDVIARQFARRVALVGNSDAHDQVAVGAAYTEFPGHTLDDYLQALLNRQTRPVFVQRPQLSREAKHFTQRRSMTRPGWVGNLARELRDRQSGSECG